MSSNKGFYNESLIAEALNGKTFAQNNRNLQTMIRDLFGYESEEEIIQSGQIDGPFKPDIYITYKGITKNISIKSGKTNQVHEENIQKFILFLRSLGISKRAQKILLLYHYGDGTMDGTGKKRRDNMHTRMWLDTYLKELNRELNEDHDFISKVIERTMFQGILETSPKAEYIYFGTPEYGRIISRKQIYTFINSKSWQHYECVHIGPVFLRPHARYANRPIRNQKDHDQVDCYWPHFSEDLDMISKRFAF